MICADIFKWAIRGKVEDTSCLLDSVTHSLPPWCHRFGKLWFWGGKSAAVVGTLGLKQWETFHRSVRYIFSWVWEKRGMEANRGNVEAIYLTKFKETHKIGTWWLMTQLLLSVDVKEANCWSLLSLASCLAAVCCLFFRGGGSSPFTEAVYLPHITLSSCTVCCDLWPPNCWLSSDLSRPIRRSEWL